MQWEFNAKTQGSRGAKRKAEVLSSKTNHRLVIARNPTLAVKSLRVIAPLQCYLMTSFHSEKIFSGRKCRELFDIRLSGGQQCGDDFAPTFCYDITVRATDFAQQTMGPQQPQLAGDGASSPALFFVCSNSGPEMSAKVAVAHPVDRIFAPADRCEQGGVFLTPRVEGAMATSIFEHGAADARTGLARRGFVRHAGQRFQIPPVGRGRYLR